MKPQLSIVIPSKDRPDLLGAVLEDLAQSSFISPGSLEVIVVLTGIAEQGSESLAMDYGIPIISLPGATFAEAMNAGVKRARVDWVWLLNNDTRVPHDLPWKLVLALLGWTSLLTSVIGMRLLYPSGLVQHAGVGFDNTGNPYTLWRNAPAEHPAVMQRRFPPAVTFASALVSRSMWDALGGLDEGYHNAFEDVDFCLKVREMGRQVLYDPSLCLTHLEGQTAGRHDHDDESWRHFAEVWLATGRLAYVTGVWPFERRG